MKQDDTLIMTVEELFLFSLSRELPYVPGVPDSMNSKATSADLTQSLEFAARVLASRGIPPAITSGRESTSPLEPLLRTLCSPQVRVIVSISDANDAIIWDLARSDNIALIHAWDRADEHFVSSFDMNQFFEKLCDLTGISAMDDSKAHDCNETITLNDIVTNSDIDIELLSRKIVEQNSESKCLNSTALASSLKGRSPTIFVMFNGSNVDQGKVALLSWIPSDPSSAWMATPNKDTITSQDSISLKHVGKTELQFACKTALEKVQ